MVLNENKFYIFSLKTTSKNVFANLNKYKTLFLKLICYEHQRPQSRAPVWSLPVPEEHHAGPGEDHTQGLGHVLSNLVRIIVIVTIASFSYVDNDNKAQPNPVM